MAEIKLAEKIRVVLPKGAPDYSVEPIDAVRWEAVLEERESVAAFLESIIRLDKTPEYSYESKSVRSHDNNGDAPPVGECWLTPRELARRELAKLKEALK